MNSLLVVKALCDNYSPGELEERLDTTLWQLADGMEVFVEEHWEEVTEMLKEDLLI